MMCRLDGNQRVCVHSQHRAFTAKLSKKKGDECSAGGEEMHTPGSKMVTLTLSVRQTFFKKNIGEMTPNVRVGCTNEKKSEQTGNRNLSAAENH
jgi:hypothetical protein